MSMNYRCLVLDHDDTVFDSGYSIHYQAFLKSLHFIKPHLPKPSFAEFTRANFHIGFMRMCQELYGFSDRDMEDEYRIWKSFTQKHTSQAFEGFKDLLIQFKQHGGVVAVVSFSERDEIVRDYRQNFDFEPDLIFAYDTHRNNLKPSPYPVYTCLDHFNLRKDSVLVIDDNPSGYLMAQNAQVEAYFCTWAHQDACIMDMIKQQKGPMLKSVDQLHSLLFK
jgi:beta-phosphoglucomutase-like phosphatase (HAD superfamily)